MPRANRLFARHGIWHITHRCHKKEFLLKFVRDRRLWRHWLFEARRRYGLSVLNYIVTCNHVHLMVACDDKDTIPSAMRLVAGRTAQSYNSRKGRRGAFWEDRYHAVPIKTQEHLFECLVYVDLNMVRAGVVSHPEQWSPAGYNEIHCSRQRYVVIDHERLVTLAEMESLAEFQRNHRNWIDETLRAGQLQREERWTRIGAGDATA
ncbi:MAG: transposase [Gammaproteobacteria bacterium]|nr:transposase [Gammaproteobacteria bacterium]NNL51771.1 transposase [Woeseiaceae bacterium]